MKTTCVLLTWCLFICASTNAQEVINQLCSSHTMDGTMVDFELYNDTVYGTGFFTEICGSDVDYAASWDGANWGASGLSLHREGHSLRTIGSHLYAVTYANTPSDSNWVFRYDGSTLDTLGAGVYLTTATNFSNLACIYDVIEFNGDIYMCGEFDCVGNQAISGVARWDGTSWNALGTGLSGNIPNNAPVMYPHQMTVFNNALYVVGNFQFADGVEVNGVGKWDGSNWTALGSGFNGTVYGVGSFNNELYVGGSFTQSNGTTLNRIAKWDGNNWVSPGFGFTDVSPNFTFVHTFYNGPTGLYIGGGLHEVTPDLGMPMNCGGMVFFDGVSVSTFSGGVSGNDIEAIINDPDDQLLVGGGVFGNGYVGIVQDVTYLEEQMSDKLQIAPNPATDVVIISSELPVEKVQIFGADGRLQLEAPVNYEIDISNWNAGVYWVRAEYNGNSLTQKIVKH